MRLSYIPGLTATRHFEAVKGVIVRRHTNLLLHPRAQAGFTLVEILIVVTILAILAAMVLPQFVSATGETRESSIKMNVYRIRSQLNLYQQQHGAWPTLANFTDQMTLVSDVDGNTAAIGTAGYPFGPYLQEVPYNANVSVDNSIGNGAIGTSAWYYDETTGEFRANDSAEMAAF